MTTDTKTPVSRRAALAGLVRRRARPRPRHRPAGRRPGRHPRALRCHRGEHSAGRAPLRGRRCWRPERDRRARVPRLRAAPARCAAGGTRGFEQLVASIGATGGQPLQVLHTIAAGDLVVIHAVVPGADPTGAPAVELMDLFRVADGRVAEHWGTANVAAAPTATPEG